MVFGLCLETVLLTPLYMPVFHDGTGVAAARQLLPGPLTVQPSWCLALLQPNPFPASARR